MSQAKDRKGKSHLDSVRAESSQIKMLSRGGGWMPPPPTSSRIKEVSDELKSSFTGQLLNLRNGFLLRREESCKYNVKGLFQQWFPNRTY